MPETAEDKARAKIDILLEKAGWKIFDRENADIDAAGAAIREFPAGGGAADYALYLDGKAAGIIEAKQAGVPLSGVEKQAEKYADGIAKGVPVWGNPLPFYYLSNGEETKFSDGLSPDNKPRNIFAFHRPDTLLRRLKDGAEKDFIRLARNMPPPESGALWAAQMRAVRGLENALARGDRRALIQMATGSGKTFTAINFIYRLIEYAEVRRVLFLVDRRNLGEQTLREFQQFQTPHHRKFHEEYGVRRLEGDSPSATDRVCIATIQRIYAMLLGRHLAPEDEERGGDFSALFKDEVRYNAALPPETFDLIVVDESHRSIYGKQSQVLEYFDARMVGLTATPGKATFAFFNRNVVMEYTHENAVADNVNVPFDVWRIRTEITERGGKVPAGYTLPVQDRGTRRRALRTLDDDFSYKPEELDRRVVASDQIRVIMRTFKDSIAEMFPGRTHMPKTVIFAKDNNHAENIIEILREVFPEKATDFARKITYLNAAGDASPQALINQFRTLYNPRIAVTVDMIATGTDIKPVEIVFFMRAVKSRSYFAQMRGRGVRVINSEDLKTVTPDAEGKDRFVIVDAVGVCDNEKADSVPMERKPHISFDKLMQSVAFGNADPDTLVSLAARFSRLHNKLSDEDRETLQKAGADLPALARILVDGADADAHFDRARKTRESRGEDGDPTESEIREAAEAMCTEAAKAVRKPEIRQAILRAKEKSEIVIDVISADVVLESRMNEDRARAVAENFRRYLEENKDEIAALQILYARSRRSRLEKEHLRELKEKLAEPPVRTSIESVWTAYMTLQKRPPKRGTPQRILTDLVSLVRHAIGEDAELVPFAARANDKFAEWLAAQQAAGREFTGEQLLWLDDIRDHIIANLSITKDDLELTPFSVKGGLGAVYNAFGDDWEKIIAELNDKLAA